MSVMTIRLPDAQHDRLRALAQSRGLSVNKLIEDLATRALTAFEVEQQFRARAARGNIPRALALLDRLEAAD